MRKSFYGILATLAIPLAFTGCGDESSPSSSNTTASLSSQERQIVAQLGQSLTSYQGMAEGYSSMAQEMATGFAGSFAPNSGRSLATNCNIDTSFTQQGMTITMRATKLDGSALTCEEAGAQFATTGIGIQMTMSMSQQGMSMNLSVAMTYKPVGALGGYLATMDMSMSVTGQGYAFSMDPLSLTISATSADAEPTIAGHMTMTMNGLSLENVALDGDGLVAPQTIRITKDGAFAATLVIGVDGSATAYDTAGNVITG